MAKPPRLVVIDTVDLPVPEASGVVTASGPDGTRIAVIGDRTTEVAVGTYADGRVGGWVVDDLADVEDWPEHDGPSQFEAIAIDGVGTLALLREDPPEVLVVATTSRRLVARIALAVPAWSTLAGKWDDPSSRGEGLALLRGGRILLAKEKKPRALVEFGPSGTRARGLSRDDFLGPDELWTPPDVAGEARYHPLAVWKLRDEAKKFLADVSDLAVGPDGSLWLLSDTSEALARIGMDRPLPRAGGEVRQTDERFRLPKDVVKPEGIAALDGDHVLLAMDTDRPRDNGLVLARPGR